MKYKKGISTIKSVLIVVIILIFVTLGPILLAALSNSLRGGL